MIDRDGALYARSLYKLAHNYGLGREFLDAYRRYRKAGDDRYAAAWAAACDWDVLDVGR